jgi:membrane fusion protein (multidrug efflux system)
MEVKVVTVEKKTVPIKVPRLAQLQSSKEVSVVARVSGFLEKIAYTEGSLLKKGDLMFVMDKRPFESSLNAAKGELAAAQARLWTANANLKRIQPLAEADAMSQSDLDSAIGEQRSAEAAVYAAKAKVTQAELDLSYTTIIAPTSGLSGDAEQREGAYLNAASSSANLSYVAQLDPIWVNFAISQNEMDQFRQAEAKGLLKVADGTRFTFEIVMADGSIFPHIGHLDFASPIYDQRTGTFKVRATVPNPDFLLRPGMYVSVNLLGVTRPHAVAIPQQAVQQKAKGQTVYLVNAEGVVEEQPVVASDWIGNEWLIDSGLQGGETLIVDGFKLIRPGMKVKALHYIPKSKSDVGATEPQDIPKPSSPAGH